VVAAGRLLGLEDDPPAPRLFFGEDTEAAVDAVMGKDSAPVLAVGPGVDWVGKRWPDERFTKVAARLLADDGVLAGGRLLIVGEEADRDSAHTIRLACPRGRVIEAEARLDWLQTACAISRAKLYLGGDSIWTHLATASGTPVVAVFGPSDDLRHGPWNGTAVRGPRALNDYRRTDPRLDQAINHMMDLPVEPVTEAALALLAKGEAPVGTPVEPARG
jgi:ADP-heptose:LPS heptosyltransferase